MTTANPTPPSKEASLPPRWFISAAWVIHRAMYRLTRGRLGLRPATAKTWGMMRLTTLGRKSGQERKAILGFFEDGPNLVTMAMNGWGEPEPAWWLNLQAHPDTTVELTRGRRSVHGRAATPEERPRLWTMWGQYNGEDNLASWSRRRPRETAVVILEPRAEK